MPREPDVPHLALLFGLHEGLQRPIGTQNLVHLRLLAHLVTLPQIQVVRAHPPQRLLQLPHGGIPAALVRLGHQHHLLAQAARDRLAVYLLRQALVVQVGAVQEGDSQLDRAAHNPDAVLLPLVGHVRPAQAELRNPQTGLPQSGHGHRRIGKPRAGRRERG